MRWKLLITLLGIPLGINLGAFLPQVDGIYIGKDNRKVTSEDINNSEEKLNEVIDSEKQGTDIELLVPCMDGDLVNNWMKNIENWASDGALQSSVKDIEGIMKEITNTLYGCKGWFEQLKDKGQKEEAIRNRIKRFREYSEESSNKKFKFGFGTKFEKTLNVVDKASGKFFNGIQINFQKVQDTNSEEARRISEIIYQILLKSIKQILREGKWIKNISVNPQTSERYQAEEKPEDQWVRNLMENCSSKCWFNSSIGIGWNPSSKKDGVAKWFEEKMKSQEDNNKKMGIRDFLLSANFNWNGIKPVLKQVIWNNVYEWKEEGEQIKGTTKCWMGGWGLACPKGGVIWENKKFS
ncbi:hypothetical protein [Mycoplasma suis]|uniref:Uncharacterized protein n=1 Tax=Mycoplasma suis (strain Illinois) TaxID=768700 RepID=F0QS58_MYCSL|nr:hypothetical protein [Mycoplasma suis]ADX98328.1 hypothetical protein MSU_0807 [Mycoplasma suis str. Illinois]